MPSTRSALVSADLVASTPATRDRYLDFLRGVALLAVVVGHWLVVVPSYEEGSFDGVNALATVPLMRYLTWGFQVMPLFFVVGGVANARSWRSAQARGSGYAGWLHGRLRRLAVPSLWFVGVWTGVAVVLRSVGFDPEQVQTIAWLVVVPVWFLAVYVLVAAAAPLMYRIHGRCGLGTLPILAGCALFVDVLRFHGGTSWVSYSNFLWVFLFAQQLGFLWLDGRLWSRRRGQALLALAGLAGMAVLCTVGPYSVSLVGVPGEAVQNNAPPTVMLILAGVMQVGLALLARPFVAPMLERRRVWSAVIGWNSHAMTILLWHFTALVIGAVVLLPWGVVPVLEPGSVGWWAVRVGAVVVLSVPLALLLWIFGRIEHRSLLGGAGPAARTGIEPSARAGLTGDRAMQVALALGAAAALAVGFALVAVGGLSNPSMPAGLPLVPLGFLALGLLLLSSRTTLWLAPRAAIGGAARTRQR